MNKKEIEHFYPETKQHWREWLEQNHIDQDAVWLIHYKKNAGKPSVPWTDAVDEALCFGWIDSKAVSVDEQSYKQYYSKRKPKSTWSQVNKDKVESLLAENKMAQAGIKCIEIAKQNGSWTILDSIDALEIPKELELAFADYEGTKEKFQALSKSKQKFMLYGLMCAKTAITKEKRINEILEMLSNK
jgi:uncharacterized protein YdeI (YjbR/CyaY-like superfamily)